MKKKVEGFENIEDRNKFENRLLEKNIVAYHVWKISLNLALRISDTLAITIKEAKQYIKTGKYISKDIKTGKRNEIALNINTTKSLKEALALRESIKLNVDNEFLFVGTSNRAKSSSKHIHRSAINKAYDTAVDDLSLYINVGTHSARKTWGLHVYNKTKDIGLVMKRLNHSNEGTTLAYIGITQKKMDELSHEYNL